MNPPSYYLGCPFWGNKAWRNGLFTAKVKPGEYLSQYATVFNTVEGNTTFYGIPKAETVYRWRDAVPLDFRFTFKFPKIISHEKRLRNAQKDTEHFLKALQPLGGRVGVLFLQLPPAFCDLPSLERYLAKLPREFNYAVEARHPWFYGEGETTFNHLLGELGMDRVVFDTHRLMEFETDDPELIRSKQKKPKCPTRTYVTGPHPFLRYVGYPNPEEDRQLLGDWADRVVDWLGGGRTPYVFMHQAPDDDLAPELCRIFHDLMLQRLPELSPLPAFLGQRERPEPQQMSLF